MFYVGSDLDDNVRSTEVEKKCDIGGGRRRD